MTTQHLAARVRDLEALALAFVREQSIIGRGEDPLLYLERQEYLRALRVAVPGLETARVFLAKARQRIERGR